MFAVPEEVKGYPHPYIQKMFIKRDWSEDACGCKTLVLEALIPDEDEDPESYDCFITDILCDLEDIKKRMRGQIGAFDHVEIRTQQ
ncbi:MAG: hypothetical protein ACLFR0_08325 [Alphaproteobacteria bacterium]